MAISRSSLGAALGTALMVLAGSASLSAQRDAAVALGGGVTVYRGGDAAAGDSAPWGLVYRLGKPEGWRPTFAFNWFSTEFSVPAASGRTPLGTLRVRPVMAGYGYTWRHGDLSTTAAAVAGPSFNSFSVDDLAIAAYRQRSLALRDVRPSSAFVVRPTVNVWYDVSSRIGVLASFGYVLARPSATIVTDAGESTMRLRADALRIQFGAAYGVF